MRKAQGVEEAALAAQAAQNQGQGQNPNMNNNGMNTTTAMPINNGSQQQPPSSTIDTETTVMAEGNTGLSNNHI